MWKKISLPCGVVMAYMQFISVFILTCIILADLKTAKKRIKGGYKFSLPPIIIILILIICLEQLYAGSSWYLKPLLREQYITVYAWHSLPLFSVLFFWPFYKLVLKKILEKGLNDYLGAISLPSIKNGVFDGLKNFILCIFVLIVFAVLAIGAEHFLPDFGKHTFNGAEHSFTEKLVNLTSSYLLTSLFTLDRVLLFPLAEEFFFRGYCYNAIKERLGSVYAVLISALIFSLYHQSPLLLPQFFIIGIILARGYERSKSLSSPFVTHMLYNAVMPYFI